MDNTKSIRYAVIKQMGELRYSTYKLTQLVEGEMCPATVYNFVEGATDIGSRRASVIMAALGLVVRTKDQ